MADAQNRPTEPTQADIARAACDLARGTLTFAEGLVEALEAGRDHFPPAAVPIVDDLTARFKTIKATTEKALVELAA